MPPADQKHPQDAESESHAAGRGSLGARLNQERHRLFVGRDAELREFRHLLERHAAPRILVISGAGGIGKSMLLSKLTALAADRGLHPGRIDARNLPATNPPALSVAVLSAVQGQSQDELCLVAIDNVEQIAALESWMREHVLSLLPEHSVLILAGRWRPPVSWRADPALGRTLLEWQLGELSKEAVRIYLARRGLDPSQQRSVLEFAHGYPLAVALAAEHLLRTARPALEPQPPEDLVAPLVEWLITDAERQSRLPTLEAAAVVRRIDAPLLGALLRAEHIESQYRWLAAQPFIEHCGDGLVMHELVRSVLIRDLRRRDLPRHQRLIRRAAAYYLEGVEPADDPQRLHHRLADALYAMRWEPYIQHHYALDQPSHYLDAPHVGEIPGLVDMVERLEGADSRRWFEHWQDACPHGLTVVRDQRGQAAGLVMALLFDESELKGACADPVVEQLRRHIKEKDTLSDGGKALLMRFAMADPTYQARGHAWTQIEMLFNSLVFTPGVKLVATVGDRADDWWGAAEYANLRWLPGTEFETQHRSLALMGVDLLSEPPLVWARNCIERILGAEGRVTERAPRAGVITRTAFREAVLEALSHFHSDDALAPSALLQSRLVQDLGAQRHHSGPDVVRSLLKQAAESLPSEPPGKRLPEVLAYAYFRADSKQVTAAEALSISERTFRRRLREAERRLFERLWELETRLSLQTGDDTW